MSEKASRVVLLCYGNPGRLDDGLGPAFAAALEKMAPAGVKVEVDYQLKVEDATVLATHRIAIFADAAVRGPEPFFFRRVEPRPGLSFSSHSLEPEALLALANELFGRAPQGYVLGIRGYVFDDFGEALSPGAQQNLKAALRFALELLERQNFQQAAAAMENGGPGPQALAMEG